MIEIIAYMAIGAVIGMKLLGWHVKRCVRRNGEIDEAAMPRYWAERFLGNAK